MTETYTISVLIFFGLIYWRTRLGPLAATIRVLIHLQALLLGIRMELWLAARRCWRRHRIRVAQVRKELGVPA